MLLTGDDVDVRGWLLRRGAGVRASSEEVASGGGVLRATLLPGCLLSLSDDASLAIGRRSERCASSFLLPCLLLAEGQRGNH